MPVQKTDKIWHNGKWINWDDAKLHVLSHVVSYGSAVFEGIRCYDTPKGPAIFRLREHMQRLINSGEDLSHGTSLLRWMISATRLANWCASTRWVRVM